MKIRYSILLCFLCFLYSCQVEKKQEPVDLTPDSSLKFVIKSSQETNIDFANVVRESKHLNYFTFPYIYAGGGVAVGDINNDGLPDIFFVGNDVKNRLYLNTGNFRFEDISQKAGISGYEKLRWSTGVTMADVNADGFLDIYVCISGPSPDKQNLLYINNGPSTSSGTITFTESAKAYGLNDSGYSNQAVFFDYDNDGDLDMYLAAYPPCDFQSTNAFYVEKMDTATEEESDQLYENIGDSKFINATGKTGIFNFGLTLNASVADINNDGWYDIYVSNDFNSPDFLYINQKNGSFKNEILTYLNHTANFGMGCDIADFNNDGYVDIMQADMMPATNYGQKRNMSAMQPDYFKEAVDLGLHHQYMRNCLQMNNGNGFFSDIAELAGVANTDWSWSTLFVDLNNDGWKDLFVTNGMRKSVNNKDFSRYANRMMASKKVAPGQEYLLTRNMPVEPIANKVFVNKGDLTFSSVIDPNGLSFKGFSHGAAYADFDLDGDLDIVINNLDSPAQVIENVSTANNYLQILPKGKQKNTFGTGVKAQLFHGEFNQIQELIPSRGYLSSVEPLLHFGVGNIKEIDSIKITWPGGNQQMLTNVSTNRRIEVSEKEANKKSIQAYPNKEKSLFSEINNLGIAFNHNENTFNDFEKQVLLPHQLSKLGPALAKGDINGDGLEDIFVGGASGQSACIFYQHKEGTFTKQPVTVFEEDNIYEDTAAAIFDVDKDGDLDLYVGSGGNEFKKDSKYYVDRIYINDGTGTLTKGKGILPDIKISTATVKTQDFDNDGDIDLFVGGRLIPWDYPNPASSKFLENIDGTYVDHTQKIAPGLKDLGLVTDAVWTDYNNDGQTDLIITGEWMPITIFEKQQEAFHKIVPKSLANTEGWWYSIEASDIDKDGDIDLIAGNLGLNYKYKASVSEPFEVYYADFDTNGTKDLALGYYENNVLYPLRGKQCSTEQIPALKKKFKSYDAFARAKFGEVYDIQNSKDLLHLNAKTFASTLFLNQGNGSFEHKILPNEAQLSSVNDIKIDDFDQDGIQDIVIAGNLFSSEVETPRNDASMGLFLKGKLQENDYYMVPQKSSGLKFNKDLKALVSLKQTKSKLLIGANNNDDIQVFVFD